MRSYPKDKDDRKELEELHAEPWMIELLKLNPEYVYWGPHEDYMWVKEDGWTKPIICESWKECKLELDELNEIVHFYFQVSRDSKTCPDCKEGYHPDAQWVTESFYRHSSPFKNETEYNRDVENLMRGFSNEEPDRSPLRQANYPTEELLSKYGPEFRSFCEHMRTKIYWSDDITQDETDYLKKKGRLFKSDYKSENTTAEEVNAAQNETPPSIGRRHDGINRMYLIEHRLRRFGLPQHCPTCKGHAYVYTADAATVNLVMWLLHPRKGASRGVEVNNIQEKDLPGIYAYLKEAADRNAERFSKVVKLAKKGTKVHAKNK